MVASALPAKIKNIDKLLVHCQRRRYTAKSNIICAGDRAETLSFIIKVRSPSSSKTTTAVK